MTPFFQSGTANLPVWRHPVETARGQRGPHTLTGEYITRIGTDPALVEGSVLPGYPGMQAVEVSTIENGMTRRQRVFAEGSLDGVVGTTKLLGRTQQRSIGATWTTWSERKVTWHHNRKPITGTHASDVLRSPAHGYPAGMRVVLQDLTGGAGLVPMAIDAAGTIYTVADITLDTFKLTTLAGDAVNFTSDITAGYVLAADFAEGTVHPDHPAMFLASVTIQDNGTDWATADCTYLGKLWYKPYHRLITVAGQEVSPSIPIINGLAGGWADYRNATLALPEVVVIDTFITTSSPSTSIVPSASTPANAPAIQYFAIEGPEDAVRFQWPAGWTLMASEPVETLNAAISLSIQRNTYRYRWPLIFG